MTKLNLTALAFVCIFLFAGCSTASKPGNCGCMEGNLCGWNFYKPADLVEGQTVHCRDLCAPQCAPKPCCAPGVAFTETTAAPAEPAAAASDTSADAMDAAAMEMAPPAGSVDAR